MVLVAYLGRRIIHPVPVLFVFSKSVFGKGLKLRSCETSEKNGASQS